MAKNMKAFRALLRREIRRVQGVSHVSRIRFLDVAVTQGAVSSIDLLTVDDDPDYDLASDGTLVAEAQARSRLTSIRLNLILSPSTGGEIIEWMLLKDPDAGLGSTTSPATLFTADVNATNQSIRKNAIAYGMFRSATSKESTTVRVRIKRKAMRRIAVLADGDKLRLQLLHTAAAGNGLISGWGTITTRL